MLRPHQFWLSVLTQFSIFVNNNADVCVIYLSAMRTRWKSVLCLTPFPMSKADTGELAQEMPLVIQENVVDPELKGLDDTKILHHNRPLSRFLCHDGLAAEICLIAGACWLRLSIRHSPG